MHYVDGLSLKVLILLYASLTPSLSIASDFFGQLDNACHPLFVTTCSLPYPSDIYAYDRAIFAD